MIIGEAKPLEEILQMLEPFDRVVLAGCNGCVTVCRAGGQKEVEIVASAIRLAREAGVVVSFDPNVRSILGSQETGRATEEALASADLITPTLEEATAITGQTDPFAAARELRARGPKLVAVTLAADGAVLLADGEPLLCPGYEVEIVEPTGAGDCHAAAAMVGYLSGWALEELGLFANAADQAFAPAGDRHIDILGHTKQIPDRLAIGRSHQLHRIAWQTGVAGRFGDDFGNGPIAMCGLLPAAKNDGVATLHTQRGRIGRHIGTRLVDEENHPKRYANFLHLQAVGAYRRGNHLPDRFRQGRHFFHGHSDRIDARRRQPQTVDCRFGQAIPRRGGDVLLVRRGQGRRSLTQQPDAVPEPLLFLCSGNSGQLGRRVGSSPGHVQTVFPQIVHLNNHKAKCDSPPGGSRQEENRVPQVSKEVSLRWPGKSTEISSSPHCLRIP